jgi:hypothetical protein
MVAVLLSLSGHSNHLECEIAGKSHVRLRQVTQGTNHLESKQYTAVSNKSLADFLVLDGYFKDLASLCGLL